ncbi:MAG: sigma-70 family RNA polymerase sigma factor [Acidobacteria bacterium]|nr:sigma-70 family RNA polymerase sigma factor [Acidobacteriota bacterium]
MTNAILEMDALNPVAAVELTESAFAAAYTKGFSRTVRFLQSNGVQQELAEEISQAAWTRGWECRAQLKNPAALGVWVNSIAKNLLRVDYRRRKAVEELSEDSAIIGASTDSTALAELLSHCNQDDRELLVKHYMEGWSSNELAPALGISPVSVRVRLLRIKQSLREALQLRNFRIEAAEAA